MDPDYTDPNDDHELDDENFGESKTSLFVLGGAGLVVVALLGFIGYKALTDGLGTGIEYDGENHPSFSEFEASGEMAARIPPETVSMTVTSTPPGANIVLNGVATSLQTPATVDAVQDSLNTVGYYLHGYESQVLNIDVGGDPASIDASLVEIVMPEGWTPPPPPVEPEGGWPEGEVPPEPVTEWSLPMGRIRVETRTPGGAVDGAEVLLNGVRQEGTTPLDIDVPAGQEQHITARLAGHRDSVALVTAIPFDDFADTRFVPMELTADHGADSNRYSTIRVDTVPQQATLFLDGEDQGTRSLLNMPNPGHYVIRVEAEDHDTWERGFTAGPGIFETNARLHRPRSGPAVVSLSVEGETEPREEGDETPRTNIYVRPEYVGSPGYSIEGNGTMLLHELEAGDYTIRLAIRNDDIRVRQDLTFTFEPGIHYLYTYRLEGEEYVLVTESTEEVPEGGYPEE